MIFVTVGTHEQSFDRLVRKIDEMVRDQIISEEVFIQTGYTKYKPKYCKYESLIGNDLMQQYSMNARIIITHGGPGSIMTPFGYGKIPIVVPRQHEHNEHVDDHQVLFTKKLEEQKKVIAIYDIGTLDEVIASYDQLISSMNNNFESNTTKFVISLESICMELLNKD